MRTSPAAACRHCRCRAANPSAAAPCQARASGARSRSSAASRASSAHRSAARARTTPPAPRAPPSPARDDGGTPAAARGRFAANRVQAAPPIGPRPGRAHRGEPCTCPNVCTMPLRCARARGDARWRPASACRRLPTDRIRSGAEPAVGGLPGDPQGLRHRCDLQALLLARRQQLPLPRPQLLDSARRPRASRRAAPRRPLRPRPATARGRGGGTAAPGRRPTRDGRRDGRTARPEPAHGTRSRGRSASSHPMRRRIRRRSRSRCRPPPHPAGTRAHSRKPPPHAAPANCASRRRSQPPPRPDTLSRE